MNASLALDPLYREQRLRCLALNACRALGSPGSTPNEITILRDSITQACAELEALEKTLGESDETDVLIAVVEGIRHRLELANDSGDLLAELLAAPAESAAAE